MCVCVTVCVCVCVCRPRHPRDWTQPGFLLPSPCLSLLGARKTLSLLSAGDSARPVRKTRGRGLGERARDRVHTVGPPETSPVDTSQHTCSRCVSLHVCVLCVMCALDDVYTCTCMLCVMCAVCDVCCV